MYNFKYRMINKYETNETKVSHYRELILKLNDWLRIEKERISYEKLESDIKESMKKKH